MNLKGTLKFTPYKSPPLSLGGEEMKNEYIFEEKKIKRLEARIPAVVKTKLEEIARITGKSQSQAVQDLIVEEYDRLTKK